jgi:hypothetical protein
MFGLLFFSRSSERKNPIRIGFDKKLLVQSRLDDAEQNALKGGKKAIAKMDSRIR